MKKIEMGAPKTRKVVKKNETDDPTVGKFGVVGKLVKRIEMGVWPTSKTIDEEG